MNREFALVNRFANFESVTPVKILDCFQRFISIFHRSHRPDSEWGDYRGCDATAPSALPTTSSSAKLSGSHGVGGWFRSPPRGHGLPTGTIAGGNAPDARRSPGCMHCPPWRSGIRATIHRHWGRASGDFGSELALRMRFNTSASSFRRAKSNAFSSSTSRTSMNARRSSCRNGRSRQPRRGM